MSTSVSAAIHHFLYASAATFGPVEVALRTIVVYFCAIAIVRFGKKKFMGQNTGFDTLIAFILGSVLSRAIDGSSPLPQTIVSGFVLVGVHWLLTIVALRSHAISRLMNGHSCEIAKGGEFNRQIMNKHGVSDDDLHEAMRYNGHVDDLSQVLTAHLERSGHISVIATQRTPRVVEVAVEDGVQRIRIEIA